MDLVQLVSQLRLDLVSLLGFVLRMTLGFGSVSLLLLRFGDLLGEMLQVLLLVFVLYISATVQKMTHVPAHVANSL